MIKIKKFTNLPKEEFVAGINLVLDACCFQIKYELYRQLFGSPMGSPASPIFADLILELLEEEVINKLKLKLLFFWRYVDEILTHREVDEIKTAFNMNNFNIQFTVEGEVDGKIPFLEVVCIRRDRSIVTDWFHQETWFGRYLNYKSHLPSN